MRPGDKVVWSRLWLPVDQDVELYDDGYFADTQAFGRRLSNPRAVAIEELASNVCVVLLGEAGAGKSTSLQRSLAASDTADEVRLWFDLAEFTSDSTLADQIFKTDAISAWKLAATRVLTLTLDSFDECALDIARIDRVLMRELRELAAHRVQRLRLRIISRPGAWPESITEHLATLFGSPVSVYKLAPLRRRDVESYAEAATNDARGFMEAVRLRRLEPLARQPISLELIADQFAADGRLGMEEEVYEHVVSRLADDVRDRRPLLKNLTRAQRLRVFARIAAYTIFCNRPVIVVPRRSSNQADTISVDDLAGGTESIGEASIPIQPPLVEEALNASLFTNRSRGRLAFEGRAHAEFLAAHYLHARGVEADEAIELLVDRERGRVHPQLREVARRLAQRSKPFAKRLLDVDSVLLIRAAPRLWSETERFGAVSRALEDLASGREVDNRELEFTTFEWCDYPGLADQLRPWISSRDARLSARRLAMRIAEHRRLEVLAPAFLEVALDATAPSHLRERAATALSNLGAPETTVRLREILHAPPLRSRLQRVVVEILWPEHITPAELFEYVSTSADQFSESFLRHEVVPRLDAAGLMAGLQWATSIASVYHALPKTRPVFDRLVVAGIEQSSSHTHIAKAVVDAVARRLASHNPITFGDDIGEPTDPRHELNDTRRRTLIELMARHPPATRDNFNAAHARLVLPSDFDWLVDRIKSAADEDSVEGLVLMLRDLCWGSRVTDNTQAWNCLRSLANEYETVRRHIHLGALENARADAARVPTTSTKRKPRRPEEETDGEGSRRTRMEAAIAQARAHEDEAWPSLHWSLAEDASGNIDWQDPDLAERDTWKRLTADERDVAVAAALRYLTVAGDATAREREANTDDAYAALALLHDAVPELYAQWKGSVLASWLDVVIDRGTGSTDRTERHAALLLDTKNASPTAFCDAIVDRVRNSTSLYFLRDLRSCWDEDLARRVFAELEHVQDTQACLGTALDAMLDARALGSLDYALTVLAQSEQRSERAMVALLRHRAGDAWERLWPAITANPDCGHRVLREAAEGALPRLENEQLSTMYVWIAAKHDRDADLSGGVHFANSTAGRMSRLLREIMFELRARGTQSSFSAVMSIRGASPRPHDHDWDVRDAEDQWLRARWRPYSPSSLRDWLDDRRRRVVDSADDLLRLVVDQLRSLGASLKGTTVDMLWNSNGDTPKPKTEDVFRDFLLRELRHRLIGRRLVVNREVEIEQRARLDLYVQALSHDRHVPPFEVVLELKRSGNRELATGMADQLRDKYLCEEGCRHGVYVVAWFEDRPRSKPAKFEDAVAYFGAQAERLSDTSRKLEAIVLDLRFERTESVGEAKRRKTPRRTARPASGAKPKGAKTSKVSKGSPPTKR